MLNITNCLGRAHQGSPPLSNVTVFYAEPPDHWFSIKRGNAGGQMDEMSRARCGETAQSPHPSTHATLR